MFLGSADEITVNGNPVKVKVDRKPSQFQITGNLSGILSRGLNAIEVAEQRLFGVAREARNLPTSREPYKNSYAILVAIDDYERKCQTN